MVFSFDTNGLTIAPTIFILASSGDYSQSSHGWSNGSFIDRVSMVGHSVYMSDSEPGKFLFKATHPDIFILTTIYWISAN